MSILTTPAPFRVFVYGTLKRGFSNHNYFCCGVTSIEKAVVCGRLYALNAYIPALVIPDTAVLTHGSLDYADDRRRQWNVVVDQEQPTITDAWRMVHGEVLTFIEPERLARLDQLEGFHPPAPCLYHRVLVPVRVQSGEWLAAWVYTMGERATRYALPFDADKWEPRIATTESR